jgi:hypothetical protein
MTNIFLASYRVANGPINIHIKNGKMLFMAAIFFFFAKMEDEDFILRDLSGKVDVQVKFFC